MTSIPANLGRVPNLLRSQFMLATLSRTNVQLLEVQNQMASGRAVSRYSDDSIAASALSVLRQRQNIGQQVLSSLDNAENSLNYLDSNVAETLSLAQEAKTLAASQIGGTSDAVTRNNQAVVVDGMIAQLLRLGNAQTNGLYVFGGSTATRPPIEELRGGFRYVGEGSGLFAQLGSAADVPITIGGNNAIGETSTRVRSEVDLNPALTGTTLVNEVRGARGLGVALGVFNFQFTGGPIASVDVAAADSIGDVATILEDAIRQYETDNGVTVLGPGGVSVSGGSLRFDVPAGGGGGGPTPTLTFTDVGTGVTAQDLGLTQGGGLTSAAPSGVDLDARLTWLTPLSALSGVTVPAGTIRFRFTSGGASSITDVDLSGAVTLDDFRSRIESSVPGVRVQINGAGTGIEVVSEVAGPALSIEPTGTGPDTATQLGIRTLAPSTRVSVFNDGRGVDIVNNRSDPTTGTATRAFNTDFRVVLGNGQAFDVDLRPEDLQDVGTLLGRINAEFAAAVGQPPVNTSAPPLAAGQFTAQLIPGQNGIAFTQTGITGAIRVEKLNNSAAAEDLGLMAGSYDAGSATLRAQDRASVRVNNLFGALVRLRDALRANDSAGIALAGEQIDTSINRLAETQALVGVYANRVTRAQDRQENENIISQKMRSEIEDVDFAEAAIRLNTLQTQLTAAYRVGGDISNQSLLDFLR